MNRVYIKTYGCQMNERDSDAVSAMLRARGYRIVADENDCDVLLLNTCSVRDAAEQKAIGKAENLSARKKKNPDFILGILGCMAQNRGASLLDQLPDVDLIVGTQKFHQVPDYLDNLRAAREAGTPIGETIVDIGEEAGSQNTIKDHLAPEPDANGAVERQITAFVSIQQGCNMDCAFCIVPKTRGDERSRPMDAIVAECLALAARGVELKWFGAPDPVAFTSRYDSWRYVPHAPMPATDRVLAGIIDMRLPLTFSLDDCALIARIIRAEVSAVWQELAAVR